MKDKYFNLAKEASHFSDFHGNSHLGCVFIYKNKPISATWNTMKTNPLQKEYNKYRNFENINDVNNGAVHAEMASIIKTKYLDVDWSKVEVFVYREHKDGTYSMARPCEACMKALYDRGIKDIDYTTSNGFAYERIEQR